MRLAIVFLMTAALETTAPFPDEANGWRLTDAPASYDESTIFQYIDGHGEVYLAYGMRRCQARRYGGPAGEPDILADVFEMASAADAFGVFSHSRDGEAVPIGQTASLAAGTLLFWRNRHFVSVYSERDTPRSREALLALGRALDRALGGAGERPKLVGRLPRAELDERSVVWLRHPRILDAHARLGPGNLLAVGVSAPAVYARYSGAAGGAELVLVDYPGEPAAETAAAAFSARLLAVDGGPTRRDDGWYAQGRLRVGSTRAFVIRAASRALAEALLEATRKGETP